METDGEVRNKVEFKLLTLIVTNCYTSRKTGWGQWGGRSNRSDSLVSQRYSGAGVANASM